MLFQVGGEVTEDDAQALVRQVGNLILAVLPSPGIADRRRGRAGAQRRGQRICAAGRGYGDVVSIGKRHRPEHRRAGPGVRPKAFCPQHHHLTPLPVWESPELRVRSNSFFLSHLALYMSQPTVISGPIPPLRAHLGNSLYEVKKRNGCIRSFFGWFAHRLYMPRVVVK